MIKKYFTTIKACRGEKCKNQKGEVPKMANAMEQLKHAVVFGTKILFHNFEACAGSRGLLLLASRLGA
jgi:hypothetical protein